MSMVKKDSIRQQDGKMTTQPRCETHLFSTSIGGLFQIQIQIERSAWDAMLYGDDKIQISQTIYCILVHFNRWIDICKADHVLIPFTHTANHVKSFALLGEWSRDLEAETNVTWWTLSWWVNHLEHHAPHGLTRRSTCRKSFWVTSCKFMMARPKLSDFHAHFRDCGYIMDNPHMSETPKKLVGKRGWKKKSIWNWNPPPIFQVRMPSCHVTGFYCRAASSWTNRCSQDLSQSHGLKHDSFDMSMFNDGCYFWRCFAATINHCNYSTKAVPGRRTDANCQSSCWKQCKLSSRRQIEQGSLW